MSAELHSYLYGKMASFSVEMDRVQYILLNGKYPPSLTTSQKRNLRRLKENHVIKDGQLFYKKENKLYRVITSGKEVLDILEEFHVINGTHRGINSTHQRISDKYYWHDIKGGIKKFISICPTCRPSSVVKTQPPPIKQQLLESDLIEMEGNALPPPMKKQKTVKKNSNFNNVWEEEFFVIDINLNCICLICEKLVVFRKSSLSKHFLSKHRVYNEKYPRNTEARRKKIASMKQAHQQAHPNVSSIPVLHPGKNQCGEAIMASVKLSWKLAQAKKPYSETSFIKECAVMMVETVASKEEQDIIQKIRNIPLFADTATRQVMLCVGNVNEQMNEFLKGASAISLAVDVSTKICDTSHFCIFIRAVNEHGELAEDLLDLHPLEGRICGRDILDAVLKTCEKFAIPLEKVYSVTTDGTPAMLSRHSGFVALFQQRDDTRDDVLSYHSIIHQEHLAGLHTLESANLKEIMEDIVLIVDFLHRHASKHGQFKLLLEDYDAHYGDLVYHTVVLWLSKGQVLNHFCDMLNPIISFLTVQEKLPLKIHTTLKKMTTNEWVEKLAFLADITSHLNALSQQLRAKDRTICDLYQVMIAFVNKMRLFEHHLIQSSPNFTHFVRLSKITWHLTHTKKYVKCLQLLQSEFMDRFSEFHNKKVLFSLISNPFLLEDDDLSSYLPYTNGTNLAAAQLELIDMKSNDILRRTYNTSESLFEFWKQVVYLTTLRRIAFIVLSMFGSTYCFEQTFDVLTSVKNKYHSKLTETHSTEIVKAAVTKFKPNFAEIANHLQA